MARAPRTSSSPAPGVLASLARQLVSEWRAGPIHRLTLMGPPPSGLAAWPRNPRPVSEAAGERLLRGGFQLAGRTLEVGAGGDPWDRPCPDEAFAVALHGFGWMGDLLTCGPPGLRDGLRLWRGWRRLFDRPGVFGWSGLALERRVFNLACTVPVLLPLTTDVEAGLFLADLARQARHLLSDPGDPGRRLERAIAATLAGVALAGPAGEGLIREGLRRLERLAPLAALPDGVHASRSPERGLELLFDLGALDDALSQRGAPAPPEAARAIDRLTGGARFFVLGEHRLARFHGGESGNREATATVLALEAARVQIMKTAPYGRYQSLEGPRLRVIADAGPPPSGDWGRAACVQHAALEAAVDGRRLILGSAWSAAAPESAAALAGPTGGSCLALADVWPEAGEVRVERQEAEGGLWIDMVHDGWRPSFGLVHARRLFVDGVGGELRGEDQLRVEGVGAARPGQVPFAVRFHLAPGVAAEAIEGAAEVRLQPPDAPAWRLKSDAPRLSLEPGVVFEAGEALQTTVVVLAGETTAGQGARVRWKLSPESDG
ncbi:MAG: heparinase II/III family protein [Caulobacteraceae bacterium]|nr:heparinase II/III family protein [Caulobacteraceae bacterium]